MLVGARATMGQFPFKLGQVEYAVERVTTEFNDTTHLQEERLAAVEATAATPPADREVE